MGTSPYRDLDRPPLREADLRRGVLSPPGAAESGFWRELTVVEVTGSTNADVADAARRGAAEGMVRLAEEQTAGRGRLDRDWSAPKRSGLTFSVLLRPSQVPAALRGWLPLLAGLAVAEALEENAPAAGVGLKWPNDILAGERKLGGILAEVVGEAVVVGIGVNVSLHERELPVPTATSLALVGAGTDREILLCAMLHRLAGRYRDWCAAGGDPDAAGIRAAYVTRCRTLGRQVRILRPAGADLAGEAIAIDPLGQLVVRTIAGNGGGEEIIGAGDVIHVR